MANTDNKDFKGMLKNLKWSSQQKKELANCSRDQLQSFCQQLLDKKHKIIILTKINKIKNTSSIKTIRKRVAFIKTLINLQNL